jgi:hypothetical protein
VSAVRRVCREAAVLPLRIYRLTFSPLLPSSCRFEPTCSAYAIDAILHHGALRGTLLVLRRLLRCQPRSAGGHDPVPASTR